MLGYNHDHCEFQAATVCLNYVHDNFRRYTRAPKRKLTNRLLSSILPTRNKSCPQSNEKLRYDNITSRGNGIMKDGRAGAETLMAKLIRTAGTSCKHDTYITCISGQCMNTAARIVKFPFFFLRETQEKNQFLTCNQEYVGGWRERSITPWGQYAGGGGGGVVSLYHCFIHFLLGSIES